jgi:hypothetical protein
MEMVVRVIDYSGEDIMVKIMCMWGYDNKGYRGEWMGDRKDGW